MTAPRDAADGPERRPVLALAATPSTARRAVPFLALVGLGADIVSWRHVTRVAEPVEPAGSGGPGAGSAGEELPAGGDPSASAAVVGVGGALGRGFADLAVAAPSVATTAAGAAGSGFRPDAVLATTVDALLGLPDVPTAVWVDSPAAVHAAAAHGVEVPLTSRPSLVDTGALLVPARGLDVGRYPVLPPLVRARTRLALGLPARLVVAIDHTASPDDAATTLALVAAAVVTGPHLPLALALGTPVVTSPKAARRFGLRDGLEVEVAAEPGEADRVAAALARDEDRAAALSRRARRFAEGHLDLGHPALLVRRRLGLEPEPAHDTAARLTARLDELGTPSSSRLRLRAADAVAPFPPALLEEPA